MVRIIGNLAGLPDERRSGILAKIGITGTNHVVGREFTTLICLGGGEEA